MTEQKQSSAIFELANRLLAFLDRCSRQRTWPWFVLLVAILISVFCWVPYYPAVSDFIKTPYGQGKTWWLEHPFQVVPVEVFFPLNERHIGFNAGCASHLDKLTFRAFLPLLNQIAPFGVWTLVAACHVGALVILWISYKLVSEQTGDKVSGALLSWVLAACFAGQWGFQDYLVGDAVAVSLLLAAMFSRNALFTFLFTLASSFTDERAIAAAPLVVLYHMLKGSGGNPLKSSDFFLAIRQLWPITAAVCTCIVVRLALTKILGVSSGTSMLASVDILRAHLFSDFPERFFRVFEFLWLMPVLVLIEWWGAGKLERFRSMIFSVFLALSAFPAMVVWDIDRSLFYMLPGIILAICFWPFSTRNLRVVLLSVLLGNVIWLYPSISGLRQLDHFVSSFIVLKK